MSLAKTQAVVNGLRARGITVHEWPGWQGRGNGQVSSYVGGIVHHTGSAYGMAYQALVSGREDLAGPLCNFAGNQDGSITVISAGPANHAGASGGRSMGPLPVTGSFNKWVMGLEIVYPGISPMRDAQYRAALVWARVVADVCGGGNIQSIRAHAETSVTGKWDPGYANQRTIDMVEFRRAALNPTPVEDDMTQAQADQLQFLYDAFLKGGPSIPTGQPLKDLIPQAASAYAPVLRVEAKLSALAAEVAELKARPVADVDEEALAEALSQRGIGGISAAELIQILATVRLTPGV